MTVLSKPWKRGKALLVGIQHVHRGTKFGTLANLYFAHRDVEAFRDHLIASHGYSEDDIILMIDRRGHPGHLLPTRGNVLHQIYRLVSDAPEDCHFVFYFSGHALEEEGLGSDRASMRADGKDSEIVCADGKPILDHILHDRLVKPLQSVKGSKLFALFDCCHSETLLNLQIGKGPNNYSKLWIIPPGQLFISFAMALAHFFKLRAKIRKRSKTRPPPRRASTKWCGPPAYETEQMGELSVICLSACRDGQTAYDDTERGLTFTKCFIDAVTRKPNITWTELRDTLKELISEIQRNYEEAYLDVNHERWVQEPRYRTTPRMNLTKKVSL